MRSLIIPSLLILAGCGSSGSDCADGFGLANDGNCYPIDMNGGGNADDTATNDDTAGEDTSVDTVDTGDTNDTNDTNDTSGGGGGGDTSGGGGGGGDTSGGGGGGGDTSGGGGGGGGDTSGGGGGGGGDTSGGGGGGAPPDAGGALVTFNGSVAVTTGLTSGAACAIALFEAELGGSPAPPLDLAPFSCPTTDGGTVSISEGLHIGTSSNVYAYIIVDGDTRIGHVDQLVSGSPYTALADGDSVSFSVTLNTD